MSGPAGKCPNCSAPLVFQWSSAVQTVCASCRSVVVRHDVDLDAIGELSDIKEDGSPIQVGTRGTFEGRSFTVTGRIVYEYDDGGWNEWHIMFADQTSGWLSDAQAEYAVSRLVPTPPPAPRAEDLKVGLAYPLGDLPFEITTITHARYRGVDGDLPFEYWGKETVAFADLRAAGGRFATIDYSEETPLVFTGRFVEFDDLALTNLRDLDRRTVSGGRGFNCANCGAAIELRAVGHTRTVACTSCGAILDPADPNLRILQTADQRVRVRPKISLGSRGEWHGHPYTVIGFQQRSITVEGTSYGWEEYLLFNPERGYRYLSEYQGHWNDIRTVRDLLAVDRSHSRARVGFDKRTFKHFQHATARTDFVLGEFPWRVRTGDTVVADDYVDDQWMLSSETTGDERTWSLGEYTPGERIFKAFGVAGEPPTPHGVFANQPNPYAGRTAGLFGMFCLLAAVLGVFALGRLWTADREVVFSQEYRYAPVKPGATVEQAFVTDPFTFSSDSNVEVGLNAGVTNAWFGWDLALINAETGAAYNAVSEVEYYAGIDQDGAWTEGNRAGRLMLPRLPAGEYYLRVDPESNSGIEIPYSIRIRRDVPTLLPYGVALVALLLPPVFMFVRSASFEHRRMQESDYSDGDDSGDSDDEEDD